MLVPDEFDEIEEQKGHLTALSYQKTQNHIFERHPRDREERKKFNWWRANIKYLPMPCCPNRCRLDRNKWVTEPAKEIGLGASLFLMTQKALFFLFCLFAIINIPLMLFYFNGNGQSEVMPGFVGFLGRFSLGNLGTSEMVCNTVNVANWEKNFYFSCPYGTIRELFNFGIQKYDNQTCLQSPGTFLGEGGHDENLQWDCSLKDGLTVEGKAEMLERFNLICKG